MQCISIWVTYTADRCAYRSYTAYRLDWHILQIDVNNIIYCVLIWVAYTAGQREYWSYTAYWFESRILIQQIDVSTNHILHIGLSPTYSSSMWVQVIYCVSIWVAYTADQCEYWSCTAYWSESHILQIDVRTDHVLLIGLSHIYCRSMWVLIMYCVLVWVTYTADRCEY